MCARSCACVWYVVCGVWCVGCVCVRARARTRVRACVHVRVLVCVNPEHTTHMRAHVLTHTMQRAIRQPAGRIRIGAAIGVHVKVLRKQRQHALLARKARVLGHNLLLLRRLRLGDVPVWRRRAVNACARRTSGGMAEASGRDCRDPLAVGGVSRVRTKRGGWFSVPAQQAYAVRTELTMAAFGVLTAAPAPPPMFSENLDASA